MANELISKEKNITDNVLNKINTLKECRAIKIPANYSPENALKSAWLVLQTTVTGEKNGKKPVLEACTKDSIANALLDMVVQGLNPMKKQCYFIAYGNELKLSRSYMGTVAVAKTYAAVKKVDAFIIYEGDEFEFEIDAERGTRKIIKHKQSLDNFDQDKIKGAYAVVQFNDDMPNYIEIMSMNQIRKSWSKTKTGGAVQKEFPEEMAKRTVISRACKMIINTSDDAVLFEDDEENAQNNNTAGIDNEISEKANKDEEISFDEKDIIDEPEEQRKEAKRETVYDEKEIDKELSKDSVQMSFEADF